MVDPTLASRFVRLAYWLRPWAPPQQKPRGVEWEAVPIREGDPPLSRLYRPTTRPVVGAWLISPGLHYDGPSDARMDRLASILAALGYAVLSPAVPDLMRLRLHPAIFDALAGAFDVLEGRSETKGKRPGVLSVSVGSLGALHLASSTTHADRISRLVTFGAFADPREFVRTVICGDRHRGERRPRDPLNQPVPFLTLLEHLPLRVRDPEALAAAWRRYIRETWPRKELKTAESTAHCGIAESLASTLVPEDQDLFLKGCGARPGGLALCTAALDRAEGYYDFLDPRPHLDRITARVDLVHGTDDPVVPFSQLAALAAALPRARVHPLRLYAHSASVSPRHLAQNLPRLAGDARTMTRIVRALV
jgi:pimeloyl-ACP methyl ester carboxylesterase